MDMTMVMNMMTVMNWNLVWEGNPPPPCKKVIAYFLLVLFLCLFSEIPVSWILLRTFQNYPIFLKLNKIISLRLLFHAKVQISTSSPNQNKSGKSASFNSNQAYLAFLPVFISNTHCSQMCFTFGNSLLYIFYPSQNIL